MNNNEKVAMPVWIDKQTPVDAANLSIMCGGINQNGSDIEALSQAVALLNESKFDKVTLEGSELKFYANEVEKYSINLPTGEGGAGIPGQDGREIELRKSATHIEWRYVGDDSWTQLVSLNELQGSDGLPGKDGITPDITIGNVETLSPGSQATVTKRGTTEAPIFDFGIPQGQPGGGEGGSVDLSAYQQKNDSTLNTTDKTIVGAINEIASDTSQKANASSIYKDKNGFKRPIIVFTSDDGYLEDFTKLKPIFDKYNKKMTSYIIGSKVNQENFLNIGHLIEMQRDGFEIAGHTIDHEQPNVGYKNYFNKLVAFDNKIKELSSELIIENFAFPFGISNYTESLKQFYKSAVTYDGNISNPNMENINDYNSDLYNLKRCSLEALTYEGYYKLMIDKAISTNGILIFAMHGNKMSNIQLEYLEECIKYCILNEVSILTVSEAIKEIHGIRETNRVKKFINQIPMQITVDYEANSIEANFNTVENSYPFKEIKRVLLSDTGVETQISEESKLDGTEGQVMVKIPLFYVKCNKGVLKKTPSNSEKSIMATPIQFFISEFPLDDFVPHPAFIDNGKLKRYIYVSAFESSVQKSDGTFLKENENNINVDTDKLSSISGAIPTNGFVTCDNYKKLAKNRGQGWNIINIHTLSAIQLLWLFEYKTFDSKTFSIGVNNLQSPKRTGLTTGNDSIIGANDGTDSCSYRGMENLWGNTMSFVDGFKSEGGYKSAFFIDGSYSGFSITRDEGFVVAFGYSNEFKYIFIPTWVATSSSNSNLGCYNVGGTTYGDWNLTVGFSHTHGDKVGLFSYHHFIPIEYNKGNTRLQYL
ncbi:TPA: polysaccharide deacetylase family protein [Clostridium perfringens]|nr:polysaccharide deacetylase [Clostridium phage phiCp-D]